MAWCVYKLCNDAWLIDWLVHEQRNCLKIANFKERLWAIGSLFSLFTKERVSESLAKNIFSSVFAYYAQDQIAPVALRSFALYKRATISELLTLLFTKERPWAIRSGCSLKKSKIAKDHFLWANRSFAHKKTCLTVFPLFKPQSKSLLLLFALSLLTKERL